MKKIPICFLLIVLVLASCEKENGPGPDPVDYSDCSIPSIPDSALVMKITADTLRVDLLMEDNEIIKIPAKCVRSYKIDKDDYTLKITYHDNTTHSYMFLSDTLDIVIESVELNPYDEAPLTALIKLTTPIPRKMKISIKGKSDTSAQISQVFGSYATQHELPVYGLYINHENTVEISALDALGSPMVTKNVYITTESYDRPQSGQMNVIRNNYNPDQKNRLFLIQNAIYDGAGDIRWYTTVRGTKYFKLANDLIAIQLYADRGDNDIESPDFQIINMFGEILQSYDVPNRVHHEITEKTPGGNLLIASNAQEYFSRDDDTEDMIFEIDRESGAFVKSWDLREIFDPERERWAIEGVNDWCHLNSIEYIPSDNTLLISSKLQYFVAKIDYETGAIKWILGNHKNWDEPWQEYLLSPLNFDTTLHTDHDWVYAQHMPRLTSSGTIMVYDNGNHRPGGQYSRAVEYRVDPDLMTVEKIWSYDLDDVAYAVGSIHVYEDNSVQIGHGGKGRLYEVTPENEIVFEALMLSFYRSYPIQFY